MSASIIRLSRGQIWGTAFAVADGDKAVFYTAAHVLTDVGFNVGDTTGAADLCDDQNEFLPGAKPYILTIACWDVDCDMAAFDCSFPARPFLKAPVVPLQGQQVAIYGYLFLPGMLMPDCGVYQNLKGTITSRGRRPRCRNECFSLNVQTGEPELHGMSGGPVTVVEDEHIFVVALLNGAPDEAGGPPFVATAI
jgi:hypothetical protein